MTYGWDEMLALSFSRAAGNALRSRLGLLGADYRAVDGYKTLHSQCFRLLKLNKEDMVQADDIHAFLAAGSIDNSMSVEGGDETDELGFLGFLQAGKRVGDRLLLADHLIRNTQGKITDSDILALFKDGEVTIPLVSAFCDRYRRFRESAGKLDFTDLLEKTVEQELYPESVKILSCDEFQDFSALQVEVVRSWIHRGTIREVVFAGDDDQAIYGFGGADSSFLTGMTTDVTVTLDMSHRIPSKILMAATHVIEKNRRRIPKEPNSTTMGGEVYETSDINSALKLTETENVYMLSRTRRHLMGFRQELANKCIPYKFLGTYKSPWQSGVPKAINAVMALKNGERISYADLDIILSYIPQQGMLERGLKAKVKEYASREDVPQDVNLKELQTGWLGLGETIAKTQLEDLLSKCNKDSIKMFRLAAERHGRKVLVDDPRISLGTKHSAKGLETETVISIEPLDDLYGNDERTESERRIHYVGRTRASKKLVLLKLDSMWRF